MTTEITLPQRAAVALGTAKHETELRELVTTSASIVAVLNDDGREEAHRAAMNLRNARTSITKTGKEARDDANAFSKAVIAEEKRLISIIEPEEERVFALRDKWDADRAAERQAKIDAERKRVEDIQSKINMIRRTPLMIARQPSVVIDRIIMSLIDEEIDASYDEFKEEAEAVKREAIESMQTAMKAAMTAEADALERQRAQEVESARLASERAELARLRIEVEARRLEDERKAAEAHEEQQAKLRQERAELAKQQAEQQRAAKESQDAAETLLAAERDRLRQERAALELLQAAALASTDTSNVVDAEFIEPVAAPTLAPVISSAKVRPADEEMVTIPKSEYKRLLKDSDWLACLEAAGVDNWSGIEEAIRIKNEESVAA